MANEVTAFLNSEVPALLSDLQKYVEEHGGSNLAPRDSVPSMTYEGKVWAIAINGEKTKLQKRDDDGDLVPVPVVRVVVLDWAKERGRAYYEGAYDPGKPGRPRCWTEDGKKPDATVKEPCAKTCEECEFSKKGSRVTDNGKATVACSQHRMIVVLPITKNGFFEQPLRMKLAITSDYDGQSPDLEASGWYAFSNFMQLMRSRKVGHTAMLVVKMKFDPGVAYPKIIFGFDRWLTPDEQRHAVPLAFTEPVKKLLGGTFTPEGADGKLKDQTAEAETGDAEEADETEGATEDPAAKAAAEAAAKAAAEAAAKEAAKAARKAKKEAEAKAAAEAAAKAAAAAAVDDDDEGDIELPSTTAAEPPKTAEPAKETKTAVQQPKPAETKVPDNVSALLKDWDA
jgi:hypothetical protein